MRYFSETLQLIYKTCPKTVKTFACIKFMTLLSMKLVLKLMLALMEEVLIKAQIEYCKTINSDIF